MQILAPESGQFLFERVQGDRAYALQRCALAQDLWLQGSGLMHYPNSALIAHEGVLEIAHQGSLKLEEARICCCARKRRSPGRGPC